MKDFLLLGTAANAVTVILGSLAGIVLHKKFPERIKRTAFDAIGLFTIALGLKMALAARSFLPLVLSLLLGGVLGELCRIEDRLLSLGNFLNRGGDKNDRRFAEGMLTAFLLFCVGPMTLVGSINEGLSGDHSLLITKALMDGFGSLALASAYGPGVLFSVIPLVLFQGGISAASGYAGSFFTEVTIAQLTACGGILITGLGINLLEIRKIRVGNLLPALIFAALFCRVAFLMNLG